MSKINDTSISIYDAMQNIKNGKYVMPAFQRQYVWGMEQIEKLWDSILLDYPIATFLFWHVDDSNITWDTYFCQFLQNVTFNSRKQADTVNYELSSINVGLTDTAILDGQQRLTSLFLSLYGESYIRQKHARKSNAGGVCTKLLVELNKNKVCLDEEEYNSKKYDIRFSDKIGKLSPTQFEIKNILQEKYKNENLRNDAIDKAIVNVPNDSKDYARKILEKLCKKVYDEKLIRYTEICDMSQDDALEMFVRFNSGGKSLKKSEITMSILEAYWPSAKSEFGKLLVGDYDGFGTDFIIRLALMLYGDVIKSNINKKTAEELKNNWNSFKLCLKNMSKVFADLNIDIKHFSSSWNVLLPIAYVIYYNPNFKSCIDGIKSYLMRAIFFTYFHSGTTSKLQQMKTNINSYDFEISTELLNQIPDLRVTDAKIEDVLNAEKGSRVAGEVLYYLSADWLNKNYKYEQDHLHPYSRFDVSKPFSVSVQEWGEWRSKRNRLPNLWLLEGRENGSKNDEPLIEYFNDKNEGQRQLFMSQAIIPDGVSLELQYFGDFYEKRKEELEKRVRELLGE